MTLSKDVKDRIQQKMRKLKCSEGIAPRCEVIAPNIRSFVALAKMIVSLDSP